MALHPDLTALNHAVRRLMRAEISDAWKGAGDPADIPASEAELKAAKANYKAKLDALNAKISYSRSTKQAYGD